METHSNVSPSQANRFFNCPGSVREQAKIKVITPSNPAALEGTAIHNFAAECLVKNINPQTRMHEKVNVWDGVKNVTLKINDDFIFVTRMYMQYIDRILAEHGLTRDVLQVETKFNISEIDKDATGTTDCSFIIGDTLYVIDLKSGRGILVDPEENKQCMYYALRPFFDARMFVRKIKIVIIQPRAKDGDYIKEWETTPQRLNNFAKELRDAILKTKEPNAPLESGDWCSFCKAAGSCAALQKGVLVKAQAVLPSLDRVFPVVKDLTPEQIGNALPALSMLNIFLDALHEHAYRMAVAGQDIPNYTLVRGKKQRQWADEESVVDALFSEYGDQIYNKKVLSPAQMEKLVGKEKVADYIFVPEGDLKLVMKKEVEDEIKRKVEDVFKDVVID